MSGDGSTRGRRVLANLIWAIAVLASFVAATLWLTRPLIVGMWDQVWDRGDPLYNIWILDHNYHVFSTGQWRNYWHAPMFTPYEYSLVLSEHHLGTALWTWPVYLMTKSSVVAYNVAILVSYVLTGVGCYLLARALTVRRWLALVIGVAGIAAPFRVAQLGHLQVLMTQWLPLSLWCLLRCAQHPHWGWVVGFGASATLTTLSCMYYGLFQVLLLLPLWAVLFVRNGWYRRSGLLRAWIWVGLATVGFLAWFLQTYFVVYRQEDFYRRLDEIISGSAQPSDFLAVSAFHWSVALPGLRPQAVEFALFPGVLLSSGALLALALGARDIDWVRRAANGCGLAVAWCRHRWEIAIGLAGTAVATILWLFRGPVGICQIRLHHDFMTAPWRAVSGGFILLVAGAAAIAFVPAGWRSGRLQRRGLVFWCWCGLIVYTLFSFGPLIRIDLSPIAIGPYCILYRLVPGYSGMRVPARMCVLLLPLLVLLGAYAYDRILDLRLGPIARWSVVGLAPALLVADLAVAPIRWERVPIGDAVPSSIRWLRDNPSPGGVVVTPFIGYGDPMHLYYATYHRRPLLNGYGAFCPSEADAALSNVRSFPGGESLDTLRSHGIRYVLVDVDTMARRKLGDPVALLAACDRAHGLQRVSAAGDSPYVLYEVVPSEAFRQ